MKQCWQTTFIVCFFFNSKINKIWFIKIKILTSMDGKLKDTLFWCDDFKTHYVILYSIMSTVRHLQPVCSHGKFKFIWTLLPFQCVDGYDEGQLIGFDFQTLLFATNKFNHNSKLRIEFCTLLFEVLLKESTNIKKQPQCYIQTLHLNFSVNYIFIRDVSFESMNVNKWLSSETIKTVWMKLQ